MFFKYIFQYGGVFFLFVYYIIEVDLNVQFIYVNYLLFCDKFKSYEVYGNMLWFYCNYFIFVGEINR